MTISLISFANAEIGGMQPHSDVVGGNCSLWSHHEASPKSEEGCHGEN
jgi:hypothetical protein